MDKRVKRRIAIGAVVGLAAAGGGGAIAATQLGSPQQTSQAIVDDAAKQLGIPSAKLSDALKKALENQVDAAVKDGRLTKDEGDALKKRIESGDSPLLFAPLGGRPDFGPGHFGHAMGIELDAAATYLGMTESDLRTQLESGKSLAQIAKDKGKSVDGLVQALYDAAKKQLDDLVSAGKLTKDEETNILSDLKQRLTDHVNDTHPVGPGFGHFGFADLDAAATYLGLTADELRTQLQSGKSLAQIAKDKGKSVDGLVQALYDAAKTKLDQAVKDGKISKDDETKVLADLKTRLTDVVNRTGPPFGDRMFRDGFGPRAFGDRFGGAPMMRPDGIGPGRFGERLMPGRFGGYGRPAATDSAPTL
jgi:polyhydroxyalkanoate synthesis regulator phasin